MAGTVVASTINNDTGLFATNNAYLGIAKAWVQFNGSANPAVINNSFNVSSITYNAAGYFTINFTTAFPNINYCAVGGCNASGSQMVAVCPNSNNSFLAQAPTTSACSILTASYTAVASPVYVNVAFFSA